MIGHWVGCLAEVAIKVNICNNLSPTYKDLCKSSTVFIHELLVEPFINALFFMAVKSMVSHKPGDEPENPQANPWISLFSGAVASLYLGEVTWLIPEGLKPQFFIDYEPVIEAVLSLPGNFVGEAFYENIGHHNNILAVGTLFALVGYKVYSNIYLQEGKTEDYDFSWDNNTCLITDENQISTQ